MAASNEYSREVVELVHCRYQCLECGDVIEGNGKLIYCSCGKLGLDGKPGPAYVPYRVIADPQKCQSRCIWQFENGQLLYD